MRGNDDENCNTSQQHGIDFENLVKGAHLFKGACNAYRPGNAIYDIKGCHDEELGLDTSVKVTGSGTLYLADARRFYDIPVAHRFIVGEWIQGNDRTKYFTKIHEIIAPLRIINRLRGDLTAEEVRAFHNRITSYPVGNEAATKAARMAAKEMKAAAAGRHGLVSLDFKIDEGARRLQLSIKLEDLIAEVINEPDYVGRQSNKPLYTLYDKEFFQYPVPIALLSTSRVIIPFNPALVSSQDNAGPLFDLMTTPASDAAAEPVNDIFGEDYQRLIG